MMPRSGLVALPLELLIKICSSLCWHCQGGQKTNHTQSESSIWTHKEQAALLSLSRVCRVLREAAQPFLYHYLYTSSRFDLYFFVRTLSERPDLALRVCEVDVAHATESRLPHGARVHPNGTLTLDGGPVAEPRQDRLKDFCELRKPAEHGELVSLLLQLTPKLARARFCLPRPASCKTLAQPDVSLTLLKWLAFDSLGDGFLLDQAVPMIRLAPNLEVLHCHDCVDVTSDLGRQTLDDRPPLQNLTELSLTNSDLTAVSLSNLLSAVGPRLCKVRIQPRSRGVSTHVGDDIKFDEALAVLQPWNQTLKELSFCLYGIQHPRLLRGVGVLREFHALQTLQAESAFFDFYSRRDALTSTLPPSIRELRLLGYSNLVPALQGLLEDFLAGRFPELSRIEIDDQEYESESLVAQELRQVETAFLSAGVDFIVHDQPEETENESSVSSV